MRIFLSYLPEQFLRVTPSLFNAAVSRSHAWYEGVVPGAIAELIPGSIQAAVRSHAWCEKLASGATASGPSSANPLWAGHSLLITCPRTG